MSTEEVSKAWFIGNCIDYRKGRCDLFHDTVVCQLVKGYKQAGAELGVVGLAENKANSAKIELERELGLSLAK